MNEEPQRGGELPFARAYDFFKHMTGISLVSIGGVFAFIDGSAIKVEKAKLIIVLGAICAAGVMSLFQASKLAALESKPVPHAKLVIQVKFGQYAVTGLLMVGLGAFVQTFASVML